VIDPVTALEGLQSAIAVVKKAAKIANDLGGLAMVEAKRSGNKSNFSVAMQIENLLMETAKLESQLQLLYMQTGNIDVWNKIKARAAEMDRDDAIAARKAKEEERRKKDLEAEQMQWAIAIVIIVMFVGAVGWGLTQINELCATARCGR